MRAANVVVHLAIDLVVIAKNKFMWLRSYPHPHCPCPQLIKNMLSMENPNERPLLTYSFRVLSLITDIFYLNMHKSSYYEIAEIKIYTYDFGDSNP